MPCDQTHATLVGAVCACGHRVDVHTLTNGKRKACTHMDEKGQCPCPSPR